MGLLLTRGFRLVTVLGWPRLASASLMVRQRSPTALIGVAVLAIMPSGESFAMVLVRGRQRGFRTGPAAHFRS